MYKKFIVGAMTASLMLPAAAFAQTTTQAQIESLLSQIRALQEQLRTLLASSSMPMIQKPHAPGQLGKAACIILNRNMGHGSSGDDVKKLQELLAADSENEFTVSPTGFFGALTARAMAKFQMRFGIASSSDGTVGPLTRGFFERACGKGLDDDRPDERRIRGEITATGSSQITVKPKEGNPRTVHINASTTIQIVRTATSSPTTGTMADLTVGKMVAAEGTPNADGSLTALHIKVGIVPPFVKDDRWDPRDFAERIKKHMMPNRGPGSWNSGRGNSDDDDSDDDESDDEDESEDDEDDDEDDN